MDSIIFFILSSFYYCSSTNNRLDGRISITHTSFSVSPRISSPKLPPLRATDFHRSSCDWKGVSFVAFIAIKASLTLFWNSSFIAPLMHHRARSASLVTSVADCVLFSFQGSSPPGAIPLCFVCFVSFDTLLQYVY